MDRASSSAVGSPAARVGDAPSQVSRQIRQAATFVQAPAEARRE